MYGHPQKIGAAREVCNAFIEGRKLTRGSKATDGHSLYLHGNMIATRVKGGIAVTLAGWNTVTTRRVLSEIPGVRVSTQRGQAMVNGKPVADDAVTRVPMKLPKPKGEPGTVWVTGKVWKASDGWRGYDEPVMAVCGANDTGMWSDSPCRSDVGEAELQAAEQALAKAGIRTKRVTTQSSNVFCVHHYLIAKPVDVEKAREVIAVSGLIQSSRLLYAAACNLSRRALGRPVRIVTGAPTNL